MKKILLIILSIAVLFCVTGCNSGAHTPGTKEETNESSSVTERGTAEDKIAVVCFSGTGNTMAVAETIAQVTGADLFEIIPAEKYTDEDLNYSDNDCRANKEQNDPDARPEIENDLSAISEYHTIYLGHPIWWGTNPRIIQTFLDTYDLSDADIYTFCTSGGSGIEKSVSDLQSLYPELHIVTGKRLNNASEDDVKKWIDRETNIV